ncbi:MAG: hypothetical protein R3F31_06850 [Verrucomicrobiales bacterium]
MNRFAPARLLILLLACGLVAPTSARAQQRGPGLVLPGGRAAGRTALVCRGVIRRRGAAGGTASHRVTYTLWIPEGLKTVRIIVPPARLR